MKYLNIRSFIGTTLYLSAFAITTIQGAFAISPSFVYSINGNTGDKYKVSTIFVDLFDSSPTRINNLKKQGKTVICYFSAGSAENWRPDYKKYPAAALGNNMSGWSGEKWVDYRNSTVIQLLTNRIKLAKSKGCDGVDPDNVDGHLNNTGFSLKKTDQRKFMSLLSSAAKAEGMLIGLKNSAETAADLESLTNFVVVEQCEEYNECNMYKAFSKSNKPIYQIEYRAVNAGLCANSLKRGASIIFANSALTKIEFCK